MRKVGDLLVEIIAIAMMVAMMLPAAISPAAAVDNETRLEVAVHVSEYTQSHGLSLEQVPGVTNPDYAWHYFQIYTLLEEALTSDGTPFVEVSDRDVELGELLTSSGSPKYPIFISLAAECISDTEAQAIRTYVSRGGFAYVGSSAWTRREDGSPRPSFALSTEMGLDIVSPGVSGWINMGDAGHGIRRVADHRLVDHLVRDVDLVWPMPDAYFDIMKLFACGWSGNCSSGAHKAWATRATTPTGATTLALMVGTSSPFMAVNAFVNGWFIYQAELSPLAGWGEGNVVLFEYSFFREAIDWAFEAQGLPLTRVSAWPYPNQAAFILRHDDITYPPDFILEEEQVPVEGQYFVVTGLCQPNIMPDRIAWAESHGAIVGSHSKSHVAPDTQSYNAAFTNINDSLVALGNWSGTRPTTWVAPYFGAILDTSFQAIEDCHIVASGGEQSIGPFPHYALSMLEENKHYSFVEIPPTFWLRTDGTTTLSSNDSSWTPSERDDAVDFIYELGGLIGIYDHLEYSFPILDYIDYVQTNKPRVWDTTSEEIATWWAARSSVRVSSQYVQQGDSCSLSINILGASSPLTTIDVMMTHSSAATVIIDGNASSSYLQTGRSLKINSGNASLVEVTWSATDPEPTPTRVATNSATDITINSATLNGNLTDLGVETSVDVSFQWATDAYYTGNGNTYGNETTAQALEATGPFSANLDSLAPDTTYHFRAKAVGNDTAYGDDLTLTTTQGLYQIEGITGEVNCSNLPGVSVFLYRGAELVNSTTSDLNGNYQVTAPEIGTYQAVVSKSGFRGNSTQEISITATGEYTLDFTGETGLVPNAPNMSYALACVNHWLYPVSPCGLTMSKVLQVVNAWLYQL